MVSGAPKTHFEFYRLAKAHEREGRLDEAMAAYERSIELSQSYAHSWYYKGILHQKMGQYDSAISCAEKALKLEPSWERHVTKLISECKSSKDSASS